MSGIARATLQCISLLSLSDCGQVLVDANASLCDNDGCHWASAVQKGSIGTVQVLIDAEARVDVHDNDGCTLIHYAAVEGHSGAGAGCLWCRLHTTGEKYRLLIRSQRILSNSLNNREYRQQDRARAARTQCNNRTPLESRQYLHSGSRS